MLRKELLDILVCPSCHEKVLPDEKGEWLMCERCGVKYPVEDDIPIMLIDRAVKIP